MYAAGTITITGVQQQEPIQSLFTMITQDIKNFLVRSYISDYIITTQAKEQQVGGTLALIDFANLAEKNKWKGPIDLATNHDKYFFEAWKEEVADKKQNAK